MRLCFFEDSRVAFLEPIALTRPAFALRCGVSTVLQRQCRVQKAEEVGALLRAELADLCRLQYPALVCNDSSWWSHPDTLYVNARWFPGLTPIGHFDSPRVGLIGNQVAYVVRPPFPCPAGKPETVDPWLDECKKTLPAVDARGVLFDLLWDVIDHNGQAIADDWPSFHSRHGNQETATAFVGPKDRLVVAEGATIEPCVVVDTRQGPVLIDRGAVVHAFSRLEGPCYIGPDSWVLGAKVRAGTSIGPCCRVGGEVEASILQGHSNKYHDGFLGHSYVGEWVNLAAGTQTSDLRNDYGPVRTSVAGQRLNTGRTKVGSAIADHTKTGLGALLNTGSMIGVFANVLPSGSLLPQIIPSYCQVQDGQLQERWDWRGLFTSAATVMRRRGAELTPQHRDLYLRVYDATAEVRRQSMREAEMRRLRKSV